MCRSATRGSEPFRVTHADELIADRAPASTFSEMHGENVIFGVIQTEPGHDATTRGAGPATAH
ncbi:MAG: hypothetical protein JWP48_3456 [Actinoallomurus sp.]|jgi:hypothetical protein|nr:hypothetical protein [Actinoallomurus sp.]